MQNIASQFQKISAAIQRISTDLDQFDMALQNSISTLGGEGKVAETNSQQSAVLQNLRGYSTSEVNVAANRAGQIIGGQKGQDTVAAVTGKKILDDQLPDILARANNQNIDDIGNQINEALKAGGIQGDTAASITSSVEKALQAKIGDRDGISLDEIADDVPALTSALRVMDEQVKAATSANELFEKAMIASTKNANAYIASLDEVRNRQVQGAKNRIDVENAIAEALGHRLTVEQKTSGFFEELNSLTGPNLQTQAGGQVDVQKIFDERERVQGQIRTAQQKRDSLGPAQTGELTAVQQELANLESSNSNLTKALELVADNSMQLVQSNIEAYKQRREIEDRQLNGFDKIMTANNDQLQDMVVDTNNLNQLLQGDSEQNRMRFSGGRGSENRASALRGLERLNILDIDGRESELVKTQARLNMAKAAGNPMSTMTLGTDKEGKPITQISILEKRLKELQDPDWKAPELKAAQEAAAAAQEANGKLVDIKDAITQQNYEAIGTPIAIAIDKLAIVLSNAQANSASGSGQTSTTGTGGGSGATGTGGGSGATGTGGGSGRYAGSPREQTESERARVDAQYEEAKTEYENQKQRRQAAFEEREKYGDDKTELKVMRAEGISSVEYKKRRGQSAIEASNASDAQGRAMAAMNKAEEEKNAFQTRASQSTGRFSGSIGPNTTIDNFQSPLTQEERQSASEYRRRTGGYTGPELPPNMATPPEQTVLKNLETIPTSLASIETTLGGMMDLAGVISTLGNIDSSLVTMAKSAIENKDLFTSLQNYLNGAKFTFEINASSLAGLTKFNTDFGSYVDKLANITFPDQIKLVGQHTVDVNMRGATELGQQISDTLEEQIIVKIRKAVEDTLNRMG